MSFFRFLWDEIFAKVFFEEPAATTYHEEEALSGYVHDPANELGVSYDQQPVTGLWGAGGTYYGSDYSDRDGW